MDRLGRQFFANLSLMTLEPVNGVPHSKGDSVQDRLLNLSEDQIRSLPATEQVVVRGLLCGKHQKTLAAQLGLTQGAVSTKFRRALDRIEYRKSVPQITDESYRLLQMSLDLKPSVIDLVKGMFATASQSRTAELLNEKYHPSYPYNQIRVRHCWMKLIEDLKAVPQLQWMRDAMINVNKNLYKLSEVRFPKGWHNHVGRVLHRKRKGSLCHANAGLT